MTRDQAVAGLTVFLAEQTALATRSPDIAESIAGRLYDDGGWRRIDPMKLDEVIREQIARVVSNALTAGIPSSGMMNRATEAIMRAAGQ